MAVFLGKYGLRLERPLDADVRIVPDDAALVLRGPVVGGLVKEFRRFRKHQKTMCKPRRNPHNSFVLGRQHFADPSPECRGRLAQVHGNVEHLAGDDSHELPLRLPNLIVQPSQYPLLRARVVILNEYRRQAGRLGKGSLVVTLEEETALVPIDPRLQDQDVRDIGFDDLNQNTFSSRMRSKYWP